MEPPPEARGACDLVIAVSLIGKLNVFRTLENSHTL